MQNWDIVKAAHLETIEGLARLNVEFDFATSGRFETRRAGRASGSETPASKGRSKGTQPVGSGRSAPASSTREWTQTQRWLAGATWASSSWRAASQAMTVVGGQEDEGCALIVPQHQAMNFVWLYLLAIVLICVLLSIVCFLMVGIVPISGMFALQLVLSSNRRDPNREL